MRRRFACVRPNNKNGTNHSLPGHSAGTGRSPSVASSRVSYSHTYIQQTFTLLLVVPLVAAFGALVKDAHWFIGTANLHLQKVGFVVIAGGTDGRGAIDIGPGLCPA